jgi:hypothetical protein
MTNTLPLQVPPIQTTPLEPTPSLKVANATKRTSRKPMAQALSPSSSSSSHPTTIYILYNAKASLLGKLSYACRKLSAPADQSACAACDLTHGGLRLNESDQWKVTKGKIPAQVTQLHTDELTAEVCVRVRVETSDAFHSPSSPKSVWAT